MNRGIPLSHAVPLRQREFRAIRRARISKALAAEAGISGSLTRRMIRGEQPISAPRFRQWLARLMRDGFVEVARAEVAIDARVVGCTLQPLPTTEAPKALPAALGDLCEAVGRLASAALHKSGGDDVVLDEIIKARRGLSHFEGAFLAEREEYTQ